MVLSPSCLSAVLFGFDFPPDKLSVDGGNGRGEHVPGSLFADANSRGLGAYAGDEQDHKPLVAVVVVLLRASGDASF